MFVKSSFPPEAFQINFSVPASISGIFSDVVMLGKEALKKKILGLRGRTFFIFRLSLVSFSTEFSALFTLVSCFRLSFTCSPYLASLRNISLSFLHFLGSTKDPLSARLSSGNIINYCCLLFSAFRKPTFSPALIAR